MLPSSTDDSDPVIDESRLGQNDNTTTQLTATPLLTQVAGHVFDKENSKMGMLSLGSGIVLKAIQNPPRGVRELEFYQRVTSPSCSDEDSRGVCKFLAAFHGTVEIEGVKFLKLENVTGAFQKPSVADMKMGKISYDPFAPPEKVALQRAKCPSAAILGFQISGMMVYHPFCGEFDKMDKLTGHKLTTDNMLTEGLGRFFCYPSCLRKDVISQLMLRLHDIEAWFQRQRQYVFYASSLLIVYEGLLTCDHLYSNPDKPSTVCAFHSHRLQTSVSSHRLATSSSSSHSQHCSCVTRSCDTPLVDVRMIDFTHVYPSDVEDKNYREGLNSLLKHLQQLLDLDTQHTAHVLEQA